MARGDLRQAIRAFTLDELLRWDLVVGVAVASLAVWREIVDPAGLEGALPYAVAFVGVVIGAVIAGAALTVASMDQALLRKLRLIGRDPVRYVAPFMFTAGIAVAGAVALSISAAVTPTAPVGLRAVVSGIGYGAAAWAVSSLLANLDTLVQFLGLMSDAADISEDDVQRLRRERLGEQSEGRTG